MEVKNTRILCRELFLLSLWLIQLCSANTIEMCTNKGATAVTVTLELSLSNLTHYEGNCTCRLNRINQPGNVTMEADIQIYGCDSLSLQVEKWNYQTSCGEEPEYDQTQVLPSGQFYRIFMNRNLGGSTPTIGGSITFRSLNSDKLALICEDVVYDIPPSTTTLTTSTTSHLPSTDTVEICRNNGASEVTVTLEISLSDLTHYEGNCTCRLNRVNQGGNVTMEADIQIDGCDSLYLEVEKWNYQTSCGEEPGYDQTQILLPGQFYEIFMKRSLGGSTPTIGGSITFRSLNSDTLALACEDAVYDIPPSTTTMTTSTMLMTTTPSPSHLPTILGIVGVLVGLIVLLMTICLYMRYRRKKQQEAHETNRQERVSIQAGIVSGRGDRHYETLDPRQSANPVYNVISYSNDQKRDDVIYENGNILQD